MYNVLQLFIRPTIIKYFRQIKFVIDGLDKIPNLRTVSVFEDQVPGQNRTVHWRKDLSRGGVVSFR